MFINNVPNYLFQAINNIESRFEIKFYAVGGFCRDVIMKKHPKDIDLVVESPLTDKMIEFVLDRYGVVVRSDGFATTGKNFGVWRWIVGGVEFEVARTRREIGHGSSTNTVVDTNNVSIESDLYRRDLTINAVAYDITGDKIIDPLNGRRDIEYGYLVQCSDAFVDSVERPLRVANAAAMWKSATIDPGLWLRCVLLIDTVGWGMTHSEAEAAGKYAIPKDQIWAQWEKGMLRDYPGQFLNALHEINWLYEFMPQLELMFHTPQQAEWHPEGNVGIHTVHTMNAAREIAKMFALSSEDTVVLVTAAALHDIGKPPVTRLSNKNKIISHEHDVLGAVMAAEFLKTIGAPNKVISRVVELVKLHMFHVSRLQQKSDAVARWLLAELKHNPDHMVKYIIMADVSGRPPLSGELPQKIVDVFMEVAKQNHEFVPIVTGQWLLDNFKIKPGPKLGEIIKNARKAQIRGSIKDIESAKKIMSGMGLKEKNV